MPRLIERRQFQKYSGLGLAVASTASILGSVGDSYKTTDKPEFWKDGDYPPVSEEIVETDL